MYMFYYDLDGQNNFTTRGFLIVEGLALFSVLYSPLIFVHKYVVHLGEFTYLFLVVFSNAIYGIVFSNHIRHLTKWQHDRACWFPSFMTISGLRKFIFGAVFYFSQWIIFLLLNIKYMSSNGVISTLGEVF
jgi:hypothetical protein